MSAVARITHIKNPLTIIAMFAVIAEVSGTVVLPFMQPTVQTIYVWYLMLFPILLCIGFFVFLWFKPVALYAPGDYLNENNFMLGIRPATYVEVRHKEAEETLSVEPSDDRSRRCEETVADPSALGRSSGDSVESQPTPGAPSEDAARIVEEGSDKDRPIYVTPETLQSMSSVIADSMRRRRENTALRHMEEIYGSLTNNVVIGNRVFDALAQQHEPPVVIEVVDCDGRIHLAIERALKALGRVREGTAALSLANNRSPVRGALALVGSSAAVQLIVRRISREMQDHSALYTNISVHTVDS